MNYCEKIITRVVFDIFPTELEKDPAVLKIEPTLINNNRDPGREIIFKKSLYISEIKQFLDKYPYLKTKLVLPNLNKYYSILATIIGYNRGS